MANTRANSRGRKARFDVDEAGAYTALKPRIASLDPQRVENVLNAGTPDVWYTHGAIEMKYLERWPVRPLTPVRVQTLVDKPEQVAWLTRRWYAGGPAYLMLRVDKQYLLFAGPHAKLVREGLVKPDLQALAVWKTDERGRGNWEALKHWLRWDPGLLGPVEGPRLRRLMYERQITQ